MLNDKGDLAAVELAFFALALLVTIFVLVRQGFSRQLGWIYIGVLSVLQILGASCLLYVETQHRYNNATIEASIITSAVGTGPLLLALMGFLERIGGSMERKSPSSNLFRLLHLSSLVALVLAIVGGVKTFDSDRNTAKSGHDLFEAAAILFLAIWISLVGIAAFSFKNKHLIPRPERKLLYVAAAAIPFVLGRVIYTVCIAFASAGSPFAFGNVSVWAQAFMRFLMEAVAVIMFAAVGLMIPRSHLSEDVEGLKLGEEQQGLPLGTSPVQNDMPPQTMGQQNQRKPRRIVDYRPSRLIGDMVKVFR